MKPLAVAMALLASVVLTDVHWFVMQSVSWVEMSWDASQSSEQSIADVLTGKIVCDHCDAIREGRESNGEPTIDLLSQGRLLAPINWEEQHLPEPSWKKMRWPLHTAGLPEPFVSGVQKPPPRVA